MQAHFNLVTLQDLPMASQELPLFGNNSNIPSSVPAIAAFPLTVVGIFREAIKIPSRNGKLILQVFLTILSPFSLVVLLHYHLAGPLIEEVEDSYEQNKSSVDHKQERALLGIELAFLIAFWFVCFCGMVLTVQASASVYQAKFIGLSDLMSGIWVRWKKPMITWMYVSLLTVSYAFLVKLSNMIIGVGSASTWVVGILAVAFYLFLDAHWTLGLVISVVEDEREALGRARKLIRGRRFQGFVLVLILVLLSAPIYIFFYVTATDDDDKLGPLAQFAFGLASTVLFCIAKFFTYVVFTVFYFECKQSHGEKLEVESLGHGYCLVSDKHEVDPSL